MTDLAVERKQFREGIKRILGTSCHEPARKLLRDITGEPHNHKPQAAGEANDVVGVFSTKNDDEKSTINTIIYVTVVIRSDLTHRVFQAWQENLAKKITDHQIVLSAEIQETTNYIVLSKSVGYESYKLWLRDRQEPPSVSYVASDWIVTMIKSGTFQNPLNFELRDFSNPPSTTTKTNAMSSANTLGTANGKDISPLSLVKASTLPSSIGSPSAANNELDVHSLTLVKSVSEVPSSTSTSSKLLPPVDKRTYACIQTGDIRALNANRYITDILEELQGIYELIGDEWRSQGYKKCIGMLKQQPRITKMEQLNGLKGVGSSIREKIQEIMETGTLKKLNNFKNDPKIKSLTELSGIWGVGEKTASDLMKKGFKSVQDLRDRGMHLLTQQQKVGLRHYEELKIKIPRAEVEEIRDVVMEHCQRIAPQSSCTVCGSYRRGKPQSGDVDILICPPPGIAELPGDTLPALIKSLEECKFLTDHLSLPFGYLHPNPEENGDSSESHISLVDDKKDHFENMGRYRASYMGVCQLPKPGAKHRRIDIKIYPTALYPFAILYFTGSDHFNRSMRFYAKKRGFSLSDKGLVYEEKVRFHKDIPYQIGQYIPCKTEEDIFAVLKLPYKSPQDRNVFDVDHQFSEEEKREASRRPILADSDSE